MAITTALQAAQIMNETLNRLGFNYNIDTEDSDTIEAGFKEIGAYPPSALRNILDQAVAILKFRNYGAMFDSSKNPTRVLWRDAIRVGGGEEDIFHEIIESEAGYWAEDFAGLDAQAQKALAENIAIDLVQYKKEAIKKKFHTDYDSFRIKASRTDLEISSIFTSEGFAKFVDVTMANIQWSAEVRLQTGAISVIKSMIDNRDIVFFEGHNINNESGVTAMVETLRTITDGMTGNVSTAFNKDGVLNMSSKDDLYLIATPEVINRLQTRGYANAFNLEYYRDNNRLLLLPYGTDMGLSNSGQHVLAVLVDRRAIVLAMRYWEMLPNRVENTDYINYFLQVRYIKGYNEFFNAVAICGDEIGNFIATDDAAIAQFPAVNDNGFFVNGKQVETNQGIPAIVVSNKSTLVEYNGNNQYKVYGGYSANIDNMIEYGLLNAVNTEVNLVYPINIIVKVDV